MKTKKLYITKFLSTLLSLIMFLNSLPIAAFAVTTYDLSDVYGQVTLDGTINWEDDNNADGFRPTSVEVSLYANNVEVMKQTVSGPDWKYSFDISNGVPGFDSPVGVTFTIEHSHIDKYETTEIAHPVIQFSDPSVTGGWQKTTPCSSLDISHEGVAGMSIVASKMTSGTVVIWSETPLSQFERDIVVDSLKKNASGLGNPKQYFFLSGEGANSEYGITVSSTNVVYEGTSKWSMFFVGLYEKGTSETTSSHITNTYVPEMTSVQAEKVWNDDSDRDGLRPDSITLQLYKTVNGNTTAVGAPVTVTASDNWTYQFENLHKYEDGEEIVYTVKEESVPSGYTASVETDPHNTGVIIVTNTHVPNKVSVSASKEWDDDNNRDNIRPSELTFALYANGVKVDGSEKIVNAANNWSAEWTDLNQNSAGNPIRYTVREENVPNGYTVSYSTVSSNNYLITNTRTEYAVTDISVNKIWNDSNNQDGVRPESIKIHLLANGTVIDSRIVTAKDNWTWNFTDLDKYVNGTQILYTITEDPVEGYTTKINGYNVINTHVPENDDVSVTKVWHDDDNFSRQRPDSITVHLYANGTRIATQVITAADNWTWTFTNLDKYDENGLITYTVSEDPVENYVASVYVIEEGELVIINKYQPKPVTHDEPITPPDTSDTSITALILALASIFLGGLTLKRKKDNA